MSVNNNDPANKTTFDGSFMSREIDTDTLGKIDCLNADAGVSGATFTNIQRLINSFSSMTGIATNLVYNATPSWASDIVGSVNDTYTERIEALVATYNGTTGHGHSGVDGDGAKISLAAAITGVLGIAFGGTNSSTPLGNNKIMTSEGGSIVEETQLHWNHTNNHLGILTATPNVGLDLNSDFAMRYTNDASTGNIDALDASGKAALHL